ncbi:MAG: MMPL family transporter, partial [Gammaproteobacteria bacterium]|nr:MMPL family transporter [Gammaproteobacteria bacterium]
DLLDDFAEMETLQSNEEYTFLSGPEETEALNAINKIIIDYTDANTKIAVSGSPVVLDALKSTLMEDMPVFMGSAILIITFVLYALFRRISAVFIPLSVVIFSMLSTFGLMAWANVPFTVATQILPSFLIAVGVGSSVHLLVIFYRHYDKNLDKLNAIGYAASHSGTPIVMTTFTTAIGFMSFIFAKVEPVADLGWVSACGIMFVLLYSTTLVPIMISLLDIKTLKPAEAENKEGENFGDRVINSMADVSIKHPAHVLSLSILFLAVFLYGGTRVGVSYDPLSWFPEDSVVRVNTEHLNEKLRGINTFEIVFDTGIENGVYDPEFLNALESATTQILPLQVDNVFIGKVHSIANVIKEINQALNNNDPQFYTIPQSRDLIAQQFFLFENTGSEDLETIVDSQFRETRMTVKVPWENASKYVILTPQIERILNDTLPGNVKFRITGIGALYGAVLQEITTSTLESYVLALTVITALMIIFLGGLRVGLASMIPNVSPIIITVGIMGYSGITLNIFTMLVGSIAIGLAVDDTIHFMHNYKRYYFRYHGDSARAVRETLLSSGRAMAVTTLVLTTGFFVFMSSSMSNLFEFGLITGISIFMALLADFFLAPAIVILFSKHIYNPVNGWIDESKSRPVRASNNPDRRTLSGISYVGADRRANSFDRREDTMVSA